MSEKLSNDTKKTLAKFMAKMSYEDFRRRKNLEEKRKRRVHR